MNMNQQYGNNFVPPYGQDYSNFFGYRGNNYNHPMQQQNETNITWVQGIEGAKGYMLSPGSKMILLDSEIENRAYIKIADDLGATKLRKFDLIEVVEEKEVSTNLNDYVRKDELQELIMSVLPQNIQEKEVIIDESTLSANKPVVKKTVFN